jgi:hypothetical protein
MKNKNLKRTKIVSTKNPRIDKPSDTSTTAQQERGHKQAADWLRIDGLFSSYSPLLDSGRR